MIARDFLVDVMRLGEPKDITSMCELEKELIAPRNKINYCETEAVLVMIS